MANHPSDASGARLCGAERNDAIIDEMTWSCWAVSSGPLEGFVRSLSSRLSFVMLCFYFHLLRPIDRLPFEWPIVGMNVKLRRPRVDPASPNYAKMSHGSCGCHTFAIHRSFLC